VFETFAKHKKPFFALFLLLLAASLAQARETSGQSRASNAITHLWDPARYITVDEVRPEMEAYCLTVYEGTKIERFGLKVLDVLHNWRPGTDAILVRGTDERFIHTGPVAGCSGSPVYIDGRLAGALAWSVAFSKDPFYIVTPIEEMLPVGQGDRTEPADPAGPALTFDLAGPIDLTQIEQQIAGSPSPNADYPSGALPLPCPLVVSGLPTHVFEQFDAAVRPFGLMAVAGAGSGAGAPRSENVTLAPGAALAVPLITGDITVDAVGTVTEVIGNRVYAFGHSFLGYGAVDLPMAAARVHTIVSNMIFSYKFAGATQTIGALRADEAKAIYGLIGEKARMMPLTIKVDRYNDAETRTYNCRVAYNRLFTPLLLRVAVSGAALMLGNLPPDHLIHYKVNIGIQNAAPITFENVSTSQGLNEVIVESIIPVAMLMNNPYQSVNIESIETQIGITPKNIISHIWSVDLSDSRVEPGEEVEISTVVESFLAQKKKYRAAFTIPHDLTPGKYDLIVCGAYAYQRFLRKAAPYRFTPQNLSTLIEALQNILAIRRDRLYCILSLPAAGVSIEMAQLPDLPATKALILQDPKRALRATPYQHWIEKSLDTGTVIIDAKTLKITVERPQ
jgi:hypothetical protein